MYNKEKKIRQAAYNCGSDIIIDDHKITVIELAGIILYILS